MTSFNSVSGARRIKSRKLVWNQFPFPRQNANPLHSFSLQNFAIQQIKFMSLFYIQKCGEYVQQSAIVIVKTYVVVGFS